MPTEKFDLHTIEYSVQGWDAVMNTDMEKIDASIPTRIIGVLGETVAPFEALYFDKVSGKWMKAQANGAKQPCLGLAIDNGILNDSIRIHRMGEITSPAWSWASIGDPVYLSPSVAGGLTQTKPAINIQVVGWALSATKIVTAIEFNRGVEVWALSRGGTVLNPEPTVVTIWRAPFACNVVKVWGFRSGGSGGSINARKNGTLTHLASNLSLAVDNVWTDGGAVQNVGYAVGDQLEIIIATAVGAPTLIAIQVDFEL